MKAPDRLEETLDLLRDGYSDRGAAEVLGMSPSAVGHRRAYAVRAGLLDPAPDPSIPWDRVVEVCGRVASNEEAAALLGTDRQTVGRWRYVARRRGLLPRFKPKHYDRHPPLGGVTVVLDGMSREMREWLYGQVPTGGTLADALRGIVVDAYHEAEESVRPIRKRNVGR